MTRSLVDRNAVAAFLNRLGAEFRGPGEVYLIGETSHVVEGWRRWTPRLELCSSVRSSDREAFNRALRSAAAELDLPVTDECPGEIVPLPDRHEDRARSTPLEVEASFRIRHFDPYSVVIRFIARGDEPDYHLALAYLERGWVDLDTLGSLLDALLPRFTMETIQQDPAEFRRKYGGLLQMARSIDPGVTFRPTPV